MYDQPRVFLDELPWDLRSRNSDWRYVRFALPQLADYEPDLRLIPQRSRRVSALGNAKTILAAAGRRVGLHFSEYRLDTSHLDARELARSGANMVFAHRAFPLNAGTVPVVWQSAILDPAMQRSYGVTEAALQEQIDVKGPLFARAAVVQVSTKAEAKRHAAMFPAIAEHFVGIPFFTPHVEACSRMSLERHKSAKPICILFVGNHVLRKGLAELLEAFLALPAGVQERATLTVVSNFDRSALKLPEHERITFVRGMTGSQVMAEMARSHIFVNVARFESYGLVFHEAMSQGMACLGPDWEVQREIFEDGRAGLNLRCDAGTICASLEELIRDEERRYELGLAAWGRYADRYAPAVVARQYADLFRFVLHL